MDKTGRDALVLAHQHLVRVIAMDLYQQTQGRHTLDELVSEGNLGLLAAAGRFDDRRLPAAAFPRYAQKRIRGAIIDFLRRSTQGMSIKTARLRPIIHRGESELHQVLGRAPTVAELAAHIGYPVSHITRAFQAASNVPVQDLLGKEPAVLPTSPDTIRSQQLRAILAGALQSLPERYRIAAVWNWIDGVTGKEIATCLGVSEQRVWQILAAARTKLQTYLSAKGITSAKDLL